MENYIIVNGKKIELTEEQVKLLSENTKKKSNWDRVEVNREYFSIVDAFDVCPTEEYNEECDEEIYKVANYNTDKDFMEMKALEFKFSLLLTRFRDEHDDKPDMDSYIYTILYNNEKKQWQVCNDIYFFRRMSQVYFMTETIAETALEHFKTEFEQLKKYYEKY
jgi:hypothetical protein